MRLHLAVTPHHVVVSREKMGFRPGYAQVSCPISLTYDNQIRFLAQSAINRKKVEDGIGIFKVLQAAWRLESSEAEWVGIALGNQSVICG